ncbi:hypothetical protein [Neisseria sp. 83E34]|uniref:hypothetical protein n=1 Tax=Neisseria sp. 83E34 TaxID=1692264 RepID=UPI000AE8AE77|nr:hypothetical protein [Neisseria sp. 83E34]
MKSKTGLAFPEKPALFGYTGGRGDIANKLNFATALLRLVVPLVLSAAYCLALKKVY